MKARLLPASGLAVAGAVLVALTPRLNAAGVEAQGAEYPLTLRLPGDQVNPHIALDTTGGLIVWQDAAIDGEGLGIAAFRLNGTHSPQGGEFRINESAAGDQENPRVELLPGGGAFVVWQGGPLGFQRIIGRVLRPDGTFLTGDFPVSSDQGEHQLDPQITVLSNGDVVVVWSSFRQDGLNYDVYGRRFSPDGQALGAEFRVNQELGLGRRSPAIAALASGGFTVAWIGERTVGERDNRDATGRRIAGTGAPVFEVAVYTRSFDAAGNPVSIDQRVAGTDAPAAHPTLAKLPDGRLLLAWSRRDPAIRTNGLDIAGKVLTSHGGPAGEDFLVNTFRFGDQYRPRLVSVGDGALAVWTSLGEDGSWEGVYGRTIDSGGAPSGEPFRINSTVGGGQVLPAVAGDSNGQVLVAWSGNLPRTGFELFGQRYTATQTLSAPSAPYVIGLSSSSVMVTWPAVTGLDVAAYRLYAEGGAQIAEVTENYRIVEDLAPSATFSAQLAYVLSSGEVSPRSATGSGRTWGADRNYDGLPDDWQSLWWAGSAKYPGAGEDVDGDGASNLEEWLAGTDPTDATSILRLRWQGTPLGLRLEWSTQQGSVYQIQSSPDGQSWAPLGTPRFAAGSTDSILLPSGGQVAFYRVLRVR